MIRHVMPSYFLHSLFINAVSSTDYMLGCEVSNKLMQRSQREGQWSCMRQYLRGTEEYHKH
jgi:hypothetical protein